MAELTLSPPGALTASRQLLHRHSLLGRTLAMGTLLGLWDLSSFDPRPGDAPGRINLARAWIESNPGPWAKAITAALDAENRTDQPPMTVQRLCNLSDLMAAAEKSL